MTAQSSAWPAPAADTFFRGGGEMASLMRTVDWSATPLGPVETWTASLRTTVSTVLASRHAMFLWWGPDLIQFYNDGYRPSLGSDRHPSALGARGRECWAEIWPIIGPEIESIMAGGEATWHEDHLVPITRGDRLEDVYWSYSYSPVQDDDGNVGGVLVTVQETTRRVVGERRVRLLQALAAGMLSARSEQDVCTATAASLRAASQDIAIALVYLIDAGAGLLRLASWTGVEPGASAAPLEIPSDTDGVWPAARTLTRTAGADDEAWVPAETIVCDRWPEPVRETLALPLTGAHAVRGAGRHDAHGILVVGLNPRLPLDDASRVFVAQLAREIAAALDAVQQLARERDALRAAAHVERALLERVFALSPSFLAVLRGPEHVVELANPAYHQLIGHRDIIGRTVREALPELAGQGFFELLDGVYATGEPYVGSEELVEIQPASGLPAAARYLNFVYQPMRGVSGAVAGVLVTGTDVTALVEARQVVERSLAEIRRAAAERDAERWQLRTVLEQAPLAIAIIGPAGEIRFANSTFERLWGRPVEDTSAATYSEAYAGYHLDGRPIASEEWAGARAVLRGEVVEGEVIEIVQAGARGVDGRRLTVWISAAPVRDAAGLITGGVVMFRDVTAERQTEQQLRDAQRLHAVGTLAGGVAHEINNQMTAVLGFGSFVLRALGPDHAQSADMRLVLQAAERAARISQQLLAFTRQQVTQRRVVDIAALVRELQPVLAQLLQSDKRLVLGPAAGATRILADPDQVQQVLINLVANARDATDTGAEVRIEIAEVKVDAEIHAPPGEPVAPGRYVRVRVVDEGHGMAPDTLMRIFDPFFTTKAVGQGTGLGLPMVFGTMRRHGGYVLARSTPRAGTTMELYWPALPRSGDAPVSAGSDDSGTAEAAAGPGHGIVVLVVEDEPLVRALAVRTLQEEGYAVLAAEDGVAALEALGRLTAAPDLVVTDVVMPRMNGRQLSEAVAARWPGVPVLFMSGHIGEGDVLGRLMPAGAPFIQKPFSPDTLARAVAALRAGVRV